MGGIWSGFVGFLEQVILWFAALTGSAGLGIILFTICARLVILPLTLSSLRSSRRMQGLQPLVKELQRKHGKDARKLQEETMKLYKEQKVNPAGSCLPMLLQLPIFFGVYRAVYGLMVPGQRQFLSPDVLAALNNPSTARLFSEPFLGILDLGQAAFAGGVFAGVLYLVLPVLSIVMQFLQQLMATPRVQDPQQKMMMRTMMFMPLVFGYIAFTFPAGAVLYWVTSSFVGVVQQYFTSGWGSLANYLKFLPPDTRAYKPPTLAATTASDATPAVESLQAHGSATAPRTDFWSVMRPLVDLEVAGSSKALLASDATEQAMDEVRHQNRSQQNARRPRRRR